MWLRPAEQVFRSASLRGTSVPVVMPSEASQVVMPSEAPNCHAERSRGEAPSLSCRVKPRRSIPGCHAKRSQGEAPSLSCRAKPRRSTQPVMPSEAEAKHPAVMPSEAEAKHHSTHTEGRRGEARAKNI